MSALCQDRLKQLNQRARSLGFGSIANLGYWIYLGVDSKTLGRWETSKTNPRTRFLDAIEELLSQIEADPHHFVRRFASRRRPREDRQAS